MFDHEGCVDKGILDQSLCFHRIVHMASKL
jgi:hypothetical protein